jgi:hypothetical protein
MEGSGLRIPYESDQPSKEGSPKKEKSRGQTQFNTCFLSADTQTLNPDDYKNSTQLTVMRRGTQPFSLSLNSDSDLAAWPAIKKEETFYHIIPIGLSGEVPSIGQGMHDLLAQLGSGRVKAFY